MTPAVELVGRSDLLDQVGRLVADDRPVLLLGQSGVGKTALMEQVVADSGLDALRGGGLELLAGLPYLAIGRAVRRLDLTGDPPAVARTVEAAVGPDLLVLDDLHLADPASVAVTELLTGRVGLLASACPVPGRGRELSDRLSDVGFVVVPVPPLDDAAARQLAARMNPALTGSRLGQVLSRSGGIPLLIEELARGGPDESLARALIPRLELLSPAGRAAALRLSVDRREQAVPDPDVVRELTDAGFAVDAGPDRWRIRHGLIAEAVVQAADAEQLRRAHRDLADQGGDAAVVAVHLLGAGDLSGARRAALAAADAARALDERAAHLVVAGRATPGPDGWELLVQAAEHLASALSFDQADATLDEVGVPAAAVPQQVGPQQVAPGVWPEGSSDELQARAYAVRALAAMDRGDNPLALECSRVGLALVAGDASGAEQRLLVVSARVRFASGTGTVDEITQLVDRAAGLGRATGRRAAAEEVVGMIRYGTDPLAAERIWRGALTLARAEGDIITEMRCGHHVFFASETNGDPEELLGLCRELMERAEGLGLGQWRALFQTSAGIALNHLGRFAQALQELDAVDAFPLPRGVRQSAVLARSIVLAELGLTTEALRLLQAWRSELTPAELQGPEAILNDTGMRYARALIELNGGRPQQALAIIEDRPAAGDHDDVVILAELAAWAQVDLGLPVTVQVSVQSQLMLQGMAAVIAGVALLQDRPAQAAEALDRAADQVGRYSFNSSLRARWGAAEARRRSGAQDAVALLLAVEAQAQDAGMAPLLARIHRSLRLAGVSRSAPRAQDRSGLVTVRERQVLDLVAAGWSNADIARRLGVGRPTVRRLIENARGKLDAPDRVAAAARLAGHG